MALPARLARWLLLAAGLIAAPTVSAQYAECAAYDAAAFYCTDEGSAFAAASKRRDELQPSLQQICTAFWGSANAPFQGQLVVVTGITYVGLQRNHRVRHACIDRAGNARNVGDMPAAYNRFVFGFNTANTCATRPQKALTWTGADATQMCDSGCQYNVGGSACGWLGPAGSRVYQCAAGAATPSGATCGASGPINPTTPPADTDRDGDGVGNDQDDAPDDPGCSTDCGGGGGEGPGPDDPGPEPGDGQDDGQQISENLGPKLDAIQAAIESLGGRVDATTAAINAAATSAATNAQGIISAINANGGSAPGGGGEGEGEGEGGTVTGGVDCAAPPACTGDAIQCAIVLQTFNTRCGTESLADNLATWDGPVDDGETPEIWGEAEPVDMSLMDDGGFGWSRSCPQLPTVSFMGRTISADPTGQACDFLQLLSQLILLAGFAHAGYIVASKGRA